MDSIYQLGKLASWMSSDKTNFREDDSPPPLEPGGDADKQVAESLQQFSILLEYERLQEIIPSGMYVVPSFDSPLTWHGILFVRQGFYKGGAFKFLVQLPEDYPDTPPQLCFISEVYHPMVDPQSGRVDTSGVFPEWRPVRDYASFMLPFLHRAMLRREYLSGNARPPLNTEARDFFLEDPAAFAAKAAECAQQSLTNVYQNTKGSSLQFTKGPVEAHEKILESLRATDSSYALEDRKAMFVDWFCNHYAHQRTQVGVEGHQVETILLPSAEKER
mmetsp:Transcript_45374/g.145563  ORF Transcript_45374/g.145563 Transcript_45374/m.145563 type:complete len:275 (-) Transcript_45374:17-841(-)